MQAAGLVLGARDDVHAVRRVDGVRQGLGTPAIEGQSARSTARRRRARHVSEKGHGHAGLSASDTARWRPAGPPPHH